MDTKKDFIENWSSLAKPTEDYRSQIVFLGPISNEDFDKLPISKYKVYFGVLGDRLMMLSVAGVTPINLGDMSLEDSCAALERMDGAYCYPVALSGWDLTSNEPVISMDLTFKYEKE